jgi:hypothetical protein
MGFWSNLIQGKPAFEDESGVSQPDTASANSSNRFVDASGKKTIPQVTIDHVKSHIQGASIMTTAWVKNLSTLEIELDKITVLGTKKEIDRRLRPQESHEVTIYTGPAPKNDHDHKASLQYKIVENGDYFLAEYMVEFHYESDGTYTIEELHADNVVRDI